MDTATAAKKINEDGFSDTGSALVADYPEFERFADSNGDGVINVKLEAYEKSYGGNKV